MQTIIKGQGGHVWEKKNLVTESGRKGGYDRMKCVYCHMEGKSYQLSTVEVSDAYRKDHVKECPKAPAFQVPEYVRVLNCVAVGNAFSNMLRGSIHATVKGPAGEKPSNREGVWVMGVGEPVKLLDAEYEEATEAEAMKYELSKRKKR